MANKENVPPPTPGRNALRPDGHCTPPSNSPGALGLRPWQMSAFASPPLRAISPNSKPALSRQRDHSACGRSDTPLKVRKTRENLRASIVYPDVPPPCAHASCIPPEIIAVPTSQFVDDQRAGTDIAAKEAPPLSCTPTKPVEPTLTGQPTGEHSPLSPAMHPATPKPTRMQRHKSVSRRMLYKVKQGISNRSAKPSASIRPVESESSLIRRISGRRKQSLDIPERRAQSFEVSRQCSVEYDDGVTTVSAPARSCSDSTVSTNEALDYSPSASQHGSRIATPARNIPLFSFPPVQGSPPYDLTPRPLNKALPSLPSVGSGIVNSVPHRTSIMVPYVDLTITSDRAVVNAGMAHDVWVAVEASVRSRTITLDATSALDDANLSGGSAANISLRTSTAASTGSVTSLRLCFKPADGCRLMDIVGQKSLKDLQVGQKCSLFIQIHVRELETQSSRMAKDDSATLFAELESLVGTLETDILHVEARYRHSLFPDDNVVTVRHAAKIRRPRLASRWSTIGAPEEPDLSDEVHTKLAIYLADHYPAERALRFIDRCLGVECMHSSAVNQIKQTLSGDLERQVVYNNNLEPGDSAVSAVKPSVMVTYSDMPVTCYSTTAQVIEQLLTLDENGHGTDTPHMSAVVETNAMTRTASLRANTGCGSGVRSTRTVSALTAPPRITVRSTSLNILPPVTLSALTASKAASSLNLPTTNTIASELVEEDAARKVWQHIRRTSLSAKQMVDLASEPLDATDEGLRDLHRRALANKRSVGAETLKDWKWSGKMEKMQRAEAPWL